MGSVQCLGGSPQGAESPGQVSLLICGPRCAKLRLHTYKILLIRVINCCKIQHALIFAEFDCTDRSLDINCRSKEMQVVALGWAFGHLPMVQTTLPQPGTTSRRQIWLLTGKVRVVSDCFHHSRPWELPRELCVELLREVAEYEVALVNFLAGCGVKTPCSLIISQLAHLIRVFLFCSRPGRG